LAIAVFDAAVNQGIPQAPKMLQIALGDLKVDGVIGDLTIAAAFKAEPKILRRFMAQRMIRYIRTIANDSTQEGFADDWSNRLMSLAELIFEKHS
jgi:lysozyme family protein